MNSDILIRILWAVAIAAAGWALFRLSNWVLLRRATGASSPSSSSGSPSILYFTTPDCVPCKTVQRPAIRKVQDQLGPSVEVVEINAYEQPDMARQWGVLSVPTTFILDRSGKPHHINHGVTQADKLLRQIQTVS
jgi:thiol-disulfide isomerase/thioredoxin